MVRSQPLRIYQGDTVNEVVTVTDNGQPAVLTGYSAAAQIRVDVADLAPDPPTASFACTVNEAAGTVRLRMGGAETALLPSGPLVWDLQLTAPAPDGTVSTVLRGPVYVGREITL